jgi:hypothetical protein
MLRIYSGQPFQPSQRSSEPVLPDPLFLAKQDFKAVSDLCAHHEVKSGPGIVEFRLTGGESITDVVRKAADLVWRCLGETGVPAERLEALEAKRGDSQSSVLRFEDFAAIVHERDVSVVILDPIERGSKKALASRKKEGYALANELEASVAHMLYRLETSKEGLRGAVQDAELSERSGLPVEPRATQQSLFGIARVSDGLLRYSSLEGVVAGDFGKFAARFRETSPLVLIKVTERK